MIIRKKIITAICVATMTATVLSGCTKDNGKKNTSKSETVSSETPTEAPATNAPTEATEAPPKDIFVNKTFVSKSKKKNVYQKTYKPSSKAKSPDSLKSWSQKGIKKQIVKYLSMMQLIPRAKPIFHRRTALW